MVSESFREGITETLDIINYMDKSYIEKISGNFMLFLEKNKSTSYISTIDHTKSLKENKIKEETKNILATIYLNYWCTPEEKIEYKNKLNENERIFNDEIQEKYNPNKIFEKREINTEKAEEITNENVQMIKYEEESFLRKMLNKIKNIFGVQK